MITWLGRASGVILLLTVAVNDLDAIRTADGLSLRRSIADAGCSRSGHHVIILSNGVVAYAGYVYTRGHSIYTKHSHFPEGLRQARCPSTGQGLLE